MHIIKQRDDYGDEEREITPKRAQSARTYLWYHYGHRPRMIELSREAGKAHDCGLHPDGRCTKGWETIEADYTLDSRLALT